MSTPLIERTHAVVIGSGVAGLFVARVLARHFSCVTLVERDQLPDRVAFRRGVPHSHQIHLLMPGGRIAAESLLPGFESDLLGSGACVVRWPQDALWLTPAGWSRRFTVPDRHRLLSVSRPILESVARRRVLGLKNVTVVERTEAIGLVAGGDRVTGVRLRPRGEPDPSAEHELPADLVVDATGRVSRAPDWLEALGYDRPQMTLIDSFFGYASRQYAAPTDHRNNWRAIFLMPRPPHEPRCGLLFPIESGRWICTLAGAARHYPPTDPDAFVDFAASLRDPVIHDQIRDAEPLTAIQGYRQMDNRRHHFERLPRWPDRFLVVGDAACAFNPIYGQGMSVAAQTAVALDGALYARRRLDGFARRFQRRVAACSASAWLVATGDDLRYPTTEGARPGLRVRMTQRYLDRVVRAAMYSPAANEAFVDVLSLLEPPTSLFRPRVMAAALRPRLQALQPLPMPAHA